MTLPTVLREMKWFILFWLGQLITSVGSSITAFALDVWVYQRTGSVTQFALIVLFSTLPVIIFSPIAGPVVDRWNRRWTLIISDLCASFGTLAIGALFVMGKLEVWHIYVANTFNATFSAFQWPAYLAATTLLVPKQHLGRANGMHGLLQAINRILAPFIGGILLNIVHIPGIIIIDFTTLLFATFTLLVMEFPEVNEEVEEVQENSPWQDATYGLTYLFKRPGLVGLLLLIAATTFLMGGIQVVTTPLVLSLASPTVLGTILSIFGVALLAGSLLMTFWGGPKRSMSLIFGCTLLSGVSVLFAGVWPSLSLFAFFLFFFFFANPIISSLIQAIFQKKVEPGVQGRVFSVYGAVLVAGLPLGYMTIGPLVEKVFEPMMAPDGILAESVGQFIGVGTGRGMGLSLIIIGILTIVGTAIAYLYPPLRLLEDELPDVIQDEVDATQPVIAIVNDGEQVPQL